MAVSDRKTIGLLPSGSVNPLTLEVVAGHIQGLLTLAVDILPPFAPLDTAFHKTRNQYHAGMLLQFLADSASDHFRIVGVTAYDLFLPIFTHVYGEAQVPGRAAVISLYRLDVPLDAAPLDRETFLQRAAKVALHELLHTFGLTHCRHLDCLMRAVTKIADLDALPVYLCRSCQQFKEEMLRDQLAGFSNK